MGFIVKVVRVLAYLLRSGVPFVLNYLVIVFVHHFSKMGCDKVLSYFHEMNLVSEMMGGVMSLLISIWITWCVAGVLLVLYHTLRFGRQLDGVEIGSRLTCSIVLLWPLFIVYWQKASEFVSQSSLLEWVLKVV